MQTEFFFHSNIAIQALEIPQVQLWYLARSFDPDGSGWALVPHEAIERFGCHRTTLWRWLRDSRLFRSWSRTPEGFRIHYCGLLRVALALGLKTFGAISMTNTVEDLPQQAALIQALRLQRQSKWLSCLDLKNRQLDIQFPEPEDFFQHDGTAIPWDKASRVKLGGVVLQIDELAGREIVRLNTERFYGASQTGIAERLGVSRQTVAKLLEGAAKVQVAITTSVFWFQRARFLASENFGIPVESGFLWCRRGETLVSKMSPYIYYPDYELKSQRRRRTQLSKLLYRAAALAACTTAGLEAASGANNSRREASIC